MLKKKMAIVGCGKLATIIANGIVAGLVPDFSVVGCWSRSIESTNRLADLVNEGTKARCVSCHSFEEMMALKPDVVVETASPQAFKDIAFKSLENGASIITLSIGAFADRDFQDRVIETARANQTRVYIASGAIGGLDVLRTVSLMGHSELTFDTKKGPDSLKGTSVYNDSLQKEQKEVFSGSAQEAIALFPTKVNVAVAASIASVGPENCQVTISSVPGFVGDQHRIEIKNEQVNAVCEVYSQTADIAAWSVINTLRNMTSPIVF